MQRRLAHVCAVVLFVPRRRRRWIGFFVVHVESMGMMASRWKLHHAGRTRRRCVGRHGTMRFKAQIKVESNVVAAERTVAADETHVQCRACHERLRHRTDLGLLGRVHRGGNYTMRSSYSIHLNSAVPMRHHNDMAPPFNCKEHSLAQQR
ncbi:hypothetical protein AC1031_021966 [Aphanomyces cochlioides]|nr:hypothetical protein AC1031_021966 [Aphanomyces cochlioides]